MNWKSILILTVSAAVAAVVAQDVKGRGESPEPPEGGGNLVTKATMHSVPSRDFLLEWLGRQYTNDMKTLTGRIKWHGKPVRQEIDSTNRMCKIERYADGTVHVEPFAPPKPRGVVTNKAAIAARRAAIEARRNVLPGLKDAQLSTFDAKNTESNVTVNVNIGGK